MNTPLSEEQVAGLSECIFAGRKIEAIKRCREMTGLGLAEAKGVVEELERSLRASSADKFIAGAQGKGCLGVFVAGLLCVGGLAYWAA